MENNKKNYLIFLLITAVLMAVLFVTAACQPQKEKAYVIGIVNPNPGAKEITNGFISSMREFGYIEGENVTYIRSEKKKEIDSAIKEMVAKPVDLILTVTTPATRKAKQATEGTDIPVVFAMHDPVASGVVKSPADPGGNLTGVQLRGSTPKTLEWLTVTAPGTKHLFVPVAYDTRAARQSLNDLKKVSEKLGIQLTIAEVSSVEGLKESLLSVPESTDAIFILHSILVASNLDIIINTATDRKVPLVSSGHEDYKKGVVLSYGHKNTRVGGQVSRLADKLLKGVPSRRLPVEAADYFLGINLKTAQNIDMEIPDVVLKQADNIVR